MHTSSTPSTAEARPPWWARAARRAARGLPTALNLLVNMWPGGGYVDFFEPKPAEPPPPETTGDERPPAETSSTAAKAASHRRCNRPRSRPRRSRHA